MKANSLGLLAALLVCLGPVARAQDLKSELNGRLVSLKGKSVVPFPSESVAQAKYIALYYSAGWCPPCHAFTPKLVNFYNAMKPKHPEFEVIFIAQDHSEGDMQAYMEEMSMPWPALRYSYARSSRSLNKYCGPAIPSLVVLDEKGTVVSASFDGRNFVGPYKVMKDLGNLLAAQPAAAKSTAANSAATPAQASIQSPSGTNWDEVFKKSP